MANQTNELKMVTVKGRITATSNKISAEFKQGVPTKTVYFTADSLEDEQKLVDFGLRKYTTNDNETFFIAKAPAKGIQVWCQGENKGSLDSSTDAPNLQSANGVTIGLAIAKGQKMNRDFYRVTAVNVVLESDIEIVEATNPFE